MSNDVLCPASRAAGGLVRKRPDCYAYSGLDNISVPNILSYLRATAVGASGM